MQRRIQLASDVFLNIRDNVMYPFSQSWLCGAGGSRLTRFAYATITIMRDTSVKLCLSYDVDNG